MSKKTRKVGDDPALGNATRASQEKREDQRTTSVDAPASRFQRQQQTPNPTSGEKMTPADSNLIPKKIKGVGSQLKQEVASTIITGEKGVGGAVEVSSGGGEGRMAMPFSGDSGSILGSAAGTPIMDKDTQGRSRVDKKLSDANKHINYTVSEQATVEYTTVPSLAEKPDTTVGYNGNPKNYAVRMQKRSGETAAELYYDRSLDLIEKDAFVFSNGQIVKQNDVDYQDYPTLTYNPSSTTPKPDERGYIAFSTVRQNYSPRAIVIKVKKDAVDSPAYVSSFDVEEDLFGIAAACATEANRAAANEIIDVNRAELARQTIDSKAGAPTDEFFNPVGRSIRQPSRTVLYLHDKESVLGAEVFAAYKFAQKARGYYLNRASKDGQDLITPALDALYGHLLGATNSRQLRQFFGAEDGNPAFFNVDGMRAGSAAIMPMIFDSARKYQTKADFVTQPRGLRLALQTADNSMNPLRVSKSFVAALNSVDAFSTIDRGYDAMSTVEVLDNVRLVHPYSWHDALCYTRAKAGDPRTFASKLFTYAYSAGSGSNSYIIKVGDPLLNAIAWFVEQHVSSIYNALRGDEKTGEFTWKIPVIHSTTHFSLWDQIVCASVPYAIYERTNALKDILDFEKHFGYPFEDLVDIAHANPMNAVNYANPSGFEPLIVKQMLPSSAIRWIMPEMFRPTEGDCEHILAPWYMSEQQFPYAEGSTDTAPRITQTDDCAFSMPVIRDGIRLAYLDDLYAMDQKDVLLSLDALVSLPGYGDNSTIDGAIYKYSQANEGIPIIEVSGLTGLTADVVHSTPRMLGWFMDAYAGECCAPASDVTQATDLTFYDFPASNTISALSPSFRAVSYRAQNLGASDAGSRLTLGPASLTVSRAQAFTQEWHRIDSIANTGTAFHYVLDFPLTLSVSAGFDAIDLSAASDVTVNRYSIFTPSAYRRSGTQSAAVSRKSGYSFISLHDLMWAPIQKLPFVINPFDVAYVSGSFVDPFSIAYVFGLAGFVACDYNEYVYLREMDKLNKAYGFVSDPFLADSQIGRAHV